MGLAQLLIVFNRSDNHVLHLDCLFRGATSATVLYTPAPALAPSGQTCTLEAPRQGEGWIFLDWKPSVDGGAVNAYKMQRRLRSDGVWLEVGLAIESETTLTGQERAKEWEYRDSAVNKAGDGARSNTVMAVL